ncbi:ATP phosphoribosyltransferase [Sporosarcina oncorhynchi]|uniref:ATP phosphoribosyltransferase n=1 Tax=Sporosarcina oncorhynchi TaxID=3056444 RepID=A0ABZ0L954_9BACL|nr:ATP phosphoribosyltransferase [Sporosarcina sp. T2O-4]WOV88483.1 ATP phosphoribosyltransferase [Sporosarcina sp. T2O-4]
MNRLTVAMAKGRTATMALELLARVGIEFSSYSEASRKLVFTDDTNTVILIFVKSVDVPTYVENGAADIGIIGKDVLLEEQKEVYELLDLGISKCKLAVAGFPDKQLMESSRLTVASKYPNVAKAHFDKKGIRTEIIKLNGSIELAPLIGMSDVIVDIVESGKTLKENGLVILEDIAESSARLIVNKASFAIKTEQIQEFIAKVKRGVEVSA